jgi:hypothetical protein
MTYLLDIPYSVVSRDEYEWLIFSRKVLFVLVILLAAVAFTRQRMAVAPLLLQDIDEKKE